MQITSAMKMVSAAKLKKAQDAITAMRPYSDKLTELLQGLSASLEGDGGSEYADKRPVNKVLVVAITSNRGLCGGFNSNIIKQSNHLVSNMYPGKQVDFYTIGKKGHDILRKRHTILGDQSLPRESQEPPRRSQNGAQNVKNSMFKTKSFSDSIFHRFDLVLVSFLDSFWEPKSVQAAKSEKA